MAKSKPKSAAHATPADTTAAVDEFMARLEHPFKAEVETLRRLILAVDPSIAEGIKWNAPSYRTTSRRTTDSRTTSEYFATTHLRVKDGIGLILHLGAKARDLPAGGLGIDDPEKLLRWLGKDRASIELRGAADLAAKRAALQALIAQWIAHV